jgi:hypothetical protein
MSTKSQINTVTADSQTPRWFQVQVKNVSLTGARGDFTRLGLYAARKTDVGVWEVFNPQNCASVTLDTPTAKRALRAVREAGRVVYYSGFEAGRIDDMYELGF